MEANPVSQTANVSYDPGLTSQAQLRDRIIECGYRCAGQSVPNHICDTAHDPHQASLGHHHLPATPEHTAPDVSPLPPEPTQEHTAHEHSGHESMTGHEAHSPAPVAADPAAADHAAADPADHSGHADHGTPARSSQDAMGHGG